MTTPTARTTRRRQLRRLAKNTFGFERLHPEQERAILTVLSGQDTLAIMPTGAGKSAVYQLAALMLGGPAVVVSPLIALQQDQVEALGAHTDPRCRAALLNSTLTGSAREATLAAFAAGELPFLFLAPEQLASEDTLDTLRAGRPALFVVDEAHCVSEWGFDFRPEYLRLAEAVQALGHPTVLALTATAAPPVRAEIVERLGLRAPRVLVSGFDRPNLDLAAQGYDDEAARHADLLAYLQAAAKPGLVYTVTRRRAEALARDLEALGLRARAYHAGLRAAERVAVQEAFMADELEVVVATTAFGMGIDKPNVRFVAHADLPGSLDAYSQEIGRAGRDGDPAEARLFYRDADLRLRRFFAGSSPLEADRLERLLHLLDLAGGPLSTRELAGVAGLGQTRLLAALTRLEEVGAVRLLRGGRVRLTPRLKPEALPEVAEAAVTGQEHRRDYERSRLEMMRAYAATTGCRRAQLLGYFGEAFEPPCGRCDHCRAGLVEARPPDPAAPFQPGERVQHITLGAGQVTLLEPGRLTVLFDERGYQTLSLEVVLEGGLLTPLKDPAA